MICYDLVCDECGGIIHGSSTSPAVVRRDAKEQKIMVKHKGRELCCRCYEDAVSRPGRT